MLVGKHQNRSCLTRCARKRGSHLIYLERRQRRFFVLGISLFFFLNQREPGKFLHPLHCWYVFLASRCRSSCLFPKLRSQIRQALFDLEYCCSLYEREGIFSGLVLVEGRGGQCSQEEKRSFSVASCGRKEENCFCQPLATSDGCLCFFVLCTKSVQEHGRNVAEGVTGRRVP